MPLKWSTEGACSRTNAAEARARAGSREERDMARKAAGSAVGPSRKDTQIKDRTCSPRNDGHKVEFLPKAASAARLLQADWRTGVPGIVFANCDPGVATVETSAKLVRAAKPQKAGNDQSAARPRAQDDELRFENSKLQDENHMLRKQLKSVL